MLIIKPASFLLRQTNTVGKMTAFFRFPNSSSPYNIWCLSSSSSSSSPSRAATPSNLVTLSSSLRLGCYLHPRVEKLRPLLCAYFQEFYQSCRLLNINKFLTGRPFRRCSSLESLVGSFLATGKSWLCNYSGEISGKDHEGKREPHHKSASGKPFDGRLWTNIFLALNVLVYAAQLATGGRLMLLGAKVNSLINEGQIWRLATSAFLHANAVHLMVNCYSLNSVGPTVETFSGPKRYIAIYLTSAIASNLMSYWFCQSPSVGASGAIFGLVGSLALFSLRHRSLVNAPQGDLLQIGQVIVVNMLIGLSMKGIDNWGHVGGFLGGIAASWLLGPSWRFEIRKDDGRRVITDRAPIFSLIKRKRT